MIETFLMKGPGPEEAIKGLQLMNKKWVDLVADQEISSLQSFLIEKNHNMIIYKVHRALYFDNEVWSILIISFQI